MRLYFSLIQRSHPDYRDRLIAFSQYLLDSVTFESIDAHAKSFSAALFSPSFRSIHVWDKKKIRHKREGQNYGNIFSIPPHMRTWVMTERQKHIPFLSKAGVVWNADTWFLALRKTFTAASTELSNKSIAVRHLDI